VAGVVVETGGDEFRARGLAAVDLANDGVESGAALALYPGVLGV